MKLWVKLAKSFFRIKRNLNKWILEMYGKIGKSIINASKWIQASSFPKKMILVNQFLASILNKVWGIHDLSVVRRGRVASRLISQLMEQGGAAAPIFPAKITFGGKIGLAICTAFGAKTGFMKLRTAPGFWQVDHTLLGACKFSRSIYNRNSSKDIFYRILIFNSKHSPSNV